MVPVAPTQVGLVSDCHRGEVSVAAKGHQKIPRASLDVSDVKRPSATFIKAIPALNDAAASRARRTGEVVI